MDIQLSAQQQAVVDCNEPRIVVKACPGSVSKSVSGQAPSDSSDMQI